MQVAFDDEVDEIVHRVSTFMMFNDFDEDGNDVLLCQKNKEKEVEMEVDISKKQNV